MSSLSQTKLFWLVLTFLVLFSTGGCASMNRIKSANSANSSEFRVIAYATDAIVPSTIPYEKLTHINYAFLLPNPDGTFKSLLNTWTLGNLISLAHQHGVKVLISVGGWGLDAEFEDLAASQTGRETFARELVKIVEQYQFDGADIDWEYPDPGQSSQNFLLLIQQVRDALPQDKLLTAAVVALGEHAPGIPDQAFSLFDFVNVMAYDNSGQEHSSYGYAQASLDYWLGRGLKPNQVNLGVPFYARPTEVPYSKIVLNDPAAAQLDETTYAGVQINYNGIPTIQKKTRLAMEIAGGIMFWTLEDDASGELSLVSAINQVVNGSR
jgi:chitinase